MGYYVVSFNNGELYRISSDRAGGVPYDTVEFLWQAPVIASVFPYETVTGTQARPGVLEGTKANPALNSVGGVAGPFIDYGDVGGTIYFFLVGMFLGHLYRLFAAGRLFGLLLYPVFFIGLLELPR